MGQTHSQGILGLQRPFRGSNCVPQSRCVTLLGGRPFQKVGRSQEPLVKTGSSEQALGTKRTLGVFFLALPAETSFCFGPVDLTQTD
jgi:hypothetical protein